MAAGALAVQAGMIATVNTVPEKLRDEISKPEWQGWWLAAFAARLRQGQRDAVRLYPELLKMVGAHDELLEVALRALGVASMAQAQALIGVARNAEGVTESDVIDKSAAFLRECGWTCLPPSGEVSPGGAGNSGAAPESATIPGELNGGNGHA